MVKSTIPTRKYTLRFGLWMVTRLKMLPIEFYAYRFLTIHHENARLITLDDKSLWFRPLARRFFLFGTFVGDMHWYRMSESIVRL